MTLYEDNDQKNAALQQYEACSRQMEKELGIEPSNETISLYNRIRNQKAAGSIASPQKTPDSAVIPTFINGRRPAGR